MSGRDPIFSTRAECLGCDGRIVRNRDPWIEIIGKLDGSWLSFHGIEPAVAAVTDENDIPDREVYLLGWAHQSCVMKAIDRIESGTADLPQNPQPIQVEAGDHIVFDETLHLAADRQSCPFCDSREAMSDEHVWPRWYSRWLGEQGVTLNPGPNVRRLSIDVTAKICASCNNTWLSVLENDAGTLLKKMSVAARGIANNLSLTDADQKLAATWAAKTSYMIDAATEAPTIPRGYFHSLRLQKAPHEGSGVWVGRMSLPLAAKYERRFQLLEGNGQISAVVTTFSIANLVFQVYSTMFIGQVTLPFIGDQIDQAMTQIWPKLTDSAEWPSQFTIGSYEAWDRVAQRFG